MGSKSKIEQARRIARQYSADMDEVYKMMAERGMSGTAVVRKLKRRQRRQAADMARIMTLLGIHGSASLDKETVARQILRDYNAGRSDEVIDFVMTMLVRYKRKATMQRVCSLIGKALLLLMCVTAASLSFLEGKRAEFIGCIMATILYAVLLSVMTFIDDPLMAFERIAREQYWHGWNQHWWEWKKVSQVRHQGTKLLVLK